jgi:hypothetical protein
MISRIILVCLFVPFLCVGCALSSKNMIPKLDDTYHQSDKSLKIGKVGGGEDYDMWLEGTRVDDPEFLLALRSSLNESGLFKQPDASGDADYVLNALILTQDSPGAGFDMTASLFVKYTLVDTATEETVWQENIQSEFTAGCTSSCIGAVRANKAKEGAVRENLKVLIAKLSDLNL